jgi:hypothetical protein
MIVTRTDAATTRRCPYGHETVVETVDGTVWIESTIWRDIAAIEIVHKFIDRGLALRDASVEQLEVIRNGLES